MLVCDAPTGVVVAVLTAVNVAATLNGVVVFTSLKHTTTHEATSDVANDSVSFVVVATLNAAAVIMMLVVDDVGLVPMIVYTLPDGVSVPASQEAYQTSRSPMACSGMFITYVAAVVDACVVTAIS